MHDSLRLAAVALLGACGLPDAMDVQPPLPTAPAVVTVALAAGPAPTLAMYRDGLNGGWQQPERTPTGYRIFVHDVYLFVAVCNENGVAAEFYNATVADGASFQLACAPLPTATVERIEVPITGTMVQPGAVSVGADPDWYQQSSEFNWSYLEYIKDSIYDVIATTADHVQVMRDMESAQGGGTTSLPALDVDGNGLAFTGLAPTGVITDAHPEASVTYAYTTANGAQWTSSTELAVRGAVAIPTVPAAIRDPGDEQVISVSYPIETAGALATATAATSTSFGVLAPPSAFAMAQLPQPTDVQLAFAGGAAVGTAELPASYDQLALVTTGASVTESFIATHGWVDATGLDSFRYDVSAPGYDPRWTVPSTDGLAVVGLSLSYTDPATGIIYQTATSENVDTLP